MVGSVQLFGFLSRLIIILYILQRYSYIFVAQAVFLTGNISLKRRKIKQITKEKEKKKTTESEKRSSKKESKK